MEILQQAAELFKEKAAGSEGIDIGNIGSALSGLMSNAEGKLDLQGIISNMNGEGLTSMVSSWLGDGDNEGISADQVKNIFGGEKISEFASKLGLDDNAAAEGLSNAVPQIMDKVSSGGSLLDSLGDLGNLGDIGDLTEKAGGLLGGVKKMFGQ